MVMRAGELRHVITIQSATDVLTDGENIHTWATFATVRAKIETKNSIETDEGIRFYEKTIKVFTIRYYPGITQKMRIVWNGETYQITGIDNVLERDRMIKLYTTVFT